MVHLLVLCLAVSCALWVLIDVQRLKGTVDVKENNLHDFLVLSQGVTSLRSQDPTKTADRLRKLLAGRSWESTFTDLRPQIVMTGSGPLLRLVKSADGGGPGTDRDPREAPRTDIRKDPRTDIRKDASKDLREDAGKAGK